MQFLVNSKFIKWEWYWITYKMRSILRGKKLDYTGFEALCTPEQTILLHVWIWSCINKIYSFYMKSTFIIYLNVKMKELVKLEKYINLKQLNYLLLISCDKKVQFGNKGHSPTIVSIKLEFSFRYTSPFFTHTLSIVNAALKSLFARWKNCGEVLMQCFDVKIKST